VYLAPMVIGVLAINLGLGVVGAITALVSANLLAGVLVGVFAAMGPKLGMPQMALGRMTYGFVGNYLPSLLSGLTCLGYFSLGIALSAKALESAIDAPYYPALIGTAIVSVLLTAYGYDLLHYVSRWITGIGVCIFVLVTICAITKVGDMHTAATVGASDFWLNWSLIFAIAFSINGAWVIAASDYSRYLPVETKTSHIAIPAGLGVAAGYAWPMVLGALVAATTAKGAGDVFAGLDNVLPGVVGPIAITILGLSSIPHNSANHYASVMSGLSTGIRLTRLNATFITGVIATGGAFLFSGDRFEANFSNLLILIGHFILPWAAVMLVDFYIFRSKRWGLPKVESLYLRQGEFGGVNWSSLGSFLVGAVVTVPLMANSLYTGPIGRSLKIDVSDLAAFILAGAMYFVLGPLRERRVQASRGGLASHEARAVTE
jgi:NCS1 family nucleobase:cation symporter-1